MVSHLEILFPALIGGGYQVTGPHDQTYNCIAWAAGSTDAWWWPVGPHLQVYWPEGAPREETVAAFQSAFATRGYATCEGTALEVGQEKVAIYADPTGCPTHASRQRPSGRWTSKLGELEDIEHELPQLEGEQYGRVVCVMKRPLS